MLIILTSLIFSAILSGLILLVYFEVSFLFRPRANVQKLLVESLLVSFVVGISLSLLVRHLCPEGSSEFRDAINFVVSAFIVFGSLFSGVMTANSYKQNKRPFLIRKGPDESQ